MPTKRKPVTRNLVPGISEAALWRLSDGLYPKPEDLNTWELMINPGLDYPTLRFDECREVWNAAKEGIMRDWVKARPGKRPEYWWVFDAPRMSPDEVEQRGWTEWFFARTLPDPRKRLSGIGTPSQDVLNEIATFPYGIPDCWISKWQVLYYNFQVDRPDAHAFRDDRKDKIKGDRFAGVAIDPRDPPRFESQAAYLKRHGLFAPGEEQRLTDADFEPEVIRPEEDDEELSSNVVPWPGTPSGGVQ